MSILRQGRPSLLLLSAAFVLAACGGDDGGSGGSGSGGGTGGDEPLACPDIPHQRAELELCCPEFGAGACGADLFCAALQGERQAVCHALGAQADMQPCEADGECASGACNQGSCASAPGGACDPAIGCAPDKYGQHYACESGACGATGTFDIDTGAAQPAKPGASKGLFIEYMGSGHWHVFTGCNPSQTGMTCAFRVVVSADSSTTLSDPVPEDLGPNDVAEKRPDGTLFLETETADALGGMRFDATPGAAVTIDMQLDGLIQPTYFVWTADGQVRVGAPVNPIGLVPTTP